MNSTDIVREDSTGCGITAVSVVLQALFELSFLSDIQIENLSSKERELVLKSEKWITSEIHPEAAVPALIERVRAVHERTLEVQLADAVFASQQACDDLINANAVLEIKKSLDLKARQKVQWLEKAIKDEEVTKAEREALQAKREALQAEEAELLRRLEENRKRQGKK